MRLHVEPQNVWLYRLDHCPSCPSQEPPPLPLLALLCSVGSKVNLSSAGMVIIAASIVLNAAS